LLSNDSADTISSYAPPLGTSQNPLAERVEDAVDSSIGEVTSAPGRS